LLLLRVQLNPIAMNFWFICRWIRLRSVLSKRAPRTSIPSFAHMLKVTYGVGKIPNPWFGHAKVLSCW
jgi:hypothetical protein